MPKIIENCVQTGALEYCSECDALVEVHYSPRRGGRVYCDECGKEIE